MNKKNIPLKEKVYGYSLITVGIIGCLALILGAMSGWSGGVLLLLIFPGAMVVVGYEHVTKRERL